MCKLLWNVRIVHYTWWWWWWTRHCARNARTITKKVTDYSVGFCLLEFENSISITDPKLFQFFGK